MNKLNMFVSLFWAWVDMAFDPTLKLELEVDRDFEGRQAHQEKMYREKYPEIPPLGSRVDPGLEPTKVPPLKKIHMRLWRHDYGKDYHTNCTIAIDLKRERIDYSRSDSWLFKGGHKGSGIIGVFLITLPLTIASLPLICLVSIYHNHQERKYGMSRHSHTVLEALKDQLDPGTEGLLRRAMKNSWEQTKKMQKVVTLSEAKELLSRCKMIKEFGDNIDHVGESHPWEYFTWYTDEDSEDSNNYSHSIATGKFHPAYHKHYVEVLGSRFEKQEADELVKCFATKENWQDGERQPE
jgi:hypothetical protein